MVFIKRSVPRGLIKAECAVSGWKRRTGYSLSIIAVICHLWHNACMEFSRLIELVGDEPVFGTEILLAGPVDPNDVRRQLSRWVKAGRL